MEANQTCCDNPDYVLINENQYDDLNRIIWTVLTYQCKSCSYQYSQSKSAPPDEEEETP